MMARDPITTRFEFLTKNSRKSAHKYKETDQNQSLDNTNKNTLPPVNINNDWHRLLLGRLRPGVTGKYRTNRKSSNNSEISSTISTEDSGVILRSYMDDSLTLPNYTHSRLSPLDNSNQCDSLTDESLRRDNHFVKNSTNRPSNSMTSLKRRVRKQQMRLSQSSAQTIEETTTPMPSNPNFIFLPVGQAPVPPPRRFKQNPSSLVVPLPSLMTHRRATHTRIQDLKFDICVY